MMLENVLSQEIVQRLGWTLVHFVWQATVVALLLAILLTVLRKAKANVRYIITCLALGLIVLLPVITMQLVPVSIPQSPENINLASEPAAFAGPMREAREMPAVEIPILEETAQSESDGTASIVLWKQRAVERLEPALPYIVTGWLLGVFGLSVWHLGGWAQLHRIRRKMVKQVNTSLQSKLEVLAERLRVKRTVQLVESALVQIPTVIGWLRPVILLPASALTGLSSEQLEAILAHELAHIKRFDYLVNMLQTVVEILGFYHPAVWWVSHKIRAERENCCDDLAVAVSGDRVCYARALTSMEEIRARRVELAVAAGGGSLFTRICRLVGKEPRSNRDGWIPSFITFLLIAALAISMTLTYTAWAQGKTASESAEGLTKSLHQAAAEGDIEQVRLLLSKGANVNEKDEKGWTPLHTASRHGRKDIAEALIAKGAKVNAMDTSGKSPLHLAVRNEKRGCESLLIDKGANILARDNVGNTPLHLAVLWKNIYEGMLQFLLDNGAEIDAQNDYGQTPLHTAVFAQKPYFGELVAVNFLVGHGANINAKTKQGNTPLHIATRKGRKDIFELLLAKGAAIGEKTNQGLTVLHVAAALGQNDIAELLIRRIGRGNSALDFKDMQGCTPLHYASMAGSNAIVELLISNDVHVNAENARGATPAHLAIIQNHKDTVKLLISKGVDVSTIQLAAYTGDLARVKSFIEKGISVNSQDGYGLTRISHRPIEKSSLFWYNLLKTRKLNQGQGAVT